MQVVYFDGVCNLCNGFIDYLIRKDKKGSLRFAPLQGETARRLLPSEWLDDLTTVVFDDGERRYVESAAALRALAALGGFYQLVLVFLVLPGFVRDFLYRQVSRSRYRWFGRRSSCRWPSPQEADRFLP